MAGTAVDSPCADEAREGEGARHVGASDEPFETTARAWRQRELSELYERLRVAAETERQYSETLYGVVVDRIVSAVWCTIQLRLAASFSRWQTAAHFLSPPPSPEWMRPAWARPAVARERALQCAAPDADDALLEAMAAAAAATRPAWAAVLPAAAAREAIAAYAALRYPERVLGALKSAHRRALARAMGTWAWLLEPDDSGVVTRGEQYAHVATPGPAALSERAALTLVTMGAVSALDPSMATVRVQCGELACTRRLHPDGLLVRFAEEWGGQPLAETITLHLAWTHGEMWRPSETSVIGAVVIPVGGLVVDGGALAGEWVVPEAPWHRVQVSVERKSIGETSRAVPR
ncbi:hypothetical protein KFE25_007929 [Diacronema lutheri]|uniref:Uncharacterized protein n=1 Tax=Diacronema lutheri TaxID=2081491 RepID=A0A8J6CE49_DIALT|nr:hypothetical protein KFE25_007929 [Diacronema lutheri]